MDNCYIEVFSENEMYSIHVGYCDTFYGTVVCRTQLPLLWQVASQSVCLWRLSVIGVFELWTVLRGALKLRQCVWAGSGRQTLSGAFSAETQDLVKIRLPRALAVVIGWPAPSRGWVKSTCLVTPSSVAHPALSLYTGFCILIELTAVTTSITS